MRQKAGLSSVRGKLPSRWGLILALWAVVSGAAQGLNPPLLKLNASTPGKVLLGSSTQSNTVLTLEASTDFTDWQTVGTFHDGVFAYPDFQASAFPRRFYRAGTLRRGAEDDGKSQVLFPWDAFRSTNASSEVSWVKFAIPLTGPVRVYYQDSRKYPFHYDFVHQRLKGFRGMDYPAFEAVSLYRTNQQLVLGSVLYPPLAGGFMPGAGVNEYGIQFSGLEAFTPEEISRWFEWVKATVYASNGAVVYYLPSFEQSEAARTNAEALAAKGIPVASLERWVALNSCYSAGWALGQLKYFAAAEITAAFGDGRLRPEDILLTDGVPADTPLVAGILTLAPATPNSHTAILCSSFGIPFAYLPDAADRAQALAFVGHKVVLRATVDNSVGKVRLIDLEQVQDPALEAELLALKSPKPIEYRPKQPYGAFSASADGLVPTDIQYFGGKAANFGFLRRCVPSNSPPAIAFSFDLWDAFLDQVLPGGRTLRAEIAGRLAAVTRYPPDMVALKTNLAAIRDLFTKSAAFSPAQQQAITNALAPFNSRRNLRLRSSTNVEDAERFTGAGLYDSYSGCLLDDLDGDTAGPCQCDPLEAKERGVFRALQKVYGSFYNDDAFLERLIHGVDETEVGMGVLVHHSFPDAEELANGVATPAYNFAGANPTTSGQLVTQLGAVSVTNPDGASLPEIANASRSGTTLSLVLNQHSSLVPLGGYVLQWPEDYRGFLDLFGAVAQGFHQFYPTKTNFSLDFEYKKDANLGLVVKQVREVPKAAATGAATAFLLDQPVQWSVLQRGSDVFAVHRLKSLWNLHTANLRLAATNLAGGIYTTGTLEYVDNGMVQTLSGPLRTWPGASNSASGSVNAWITGSGASQRSWQLTTSLKTTVSGAQPPVFTAQDFTRTLTVAYATPQPKILGGGAVTNVSAETVWLEQRVEGSDGTLQERTLTSTNGIQVQTSFYWPKPVAGVMALSVPAQRFVQTRITGLTSVPILLTNYYSQSYGGYAHNYFEVFIFEPRLEPGIAPAILAELEAANIQLLYVATGGAGRSAAFYGLGRDPILRRL